MESEPDVTGFRLESGEGEEGVEDMGGVGDWRMEGSWVRTGVAGSILRLLFRTLGVGSVETISRDRKTFI